MGISTQITGGPVTTPGGDLLPSTDITFTLVDATTRRPVSAVDAPTSAVRIGIQTITTDAFALVDFELWPNSRGERQTLYAVLIDHADVRAFYAGVPESDTPIDWLELVTGGDALDPSAETALQLHLADDTRHLTADERAALSAANAPAGGNPIATIADVASAGGGDMHTLIYDPTGVADDAFNLSNSVGNLDGGGFT